MKFAAFSRTMHHLIVHVSELLCHETHKLTAPNMWPPNMKLVDYCIWGEVQECVNIQDMADLLQKVMSTWTGFQLGAADAASDQWQKNSIACVRTQGGHLEQRSDTACCVS